MTLFQPVRFGKYLLLDKIAAGGWAELYQGKLTGVEGFEKLIAIKMILPHLAQEKELIDCFIVEAKLAALLNHKNIVQIYDFGNIEGNYFIAMQYLYGKDLRRVINKAEIKENFLGLDYRLYIVSLICSGLSYAHGLKDLKGNYLNLIHRDITPQNILITYDGEVKIVDFGIAKAADRSSLTRIGTIKGKVAYMSPEQADGRPIDHRSDVFSTGILLYELVTGNRMFKGDTMEILSKVRQCSFDPPEPTEDIPEQVCTILNKALEKDPDRRYQSCDEMLADLETCMYDLSMWPRASGLSRIMRSLFREEIIAEEAVMQRGNDAGGAGECNQTAVAGDGYEPETVLMDSQEYRAFSGNGAGGGKPENRFFTKKRISFYAGAGFFAVILLAALGLFILNGPGDKTSPAMIVAQKKGDVAIPSEKVRDDSSTSSEPKVEEVDKALEALENGRSKEAVHLFEKALSRHPGIDRQISEYYLEALEAVTAEYSDEPGKAESYYLKAVQLGLDNVQIRFQLGLLYIRMKEFGKAVKEYKKVIEVNTESHLAFFNLGYAYAGLKNYKKAENMYARTVELAPPYMDEALYNLAVMQYFQQENTAAVNNLKKALAANPDNKKAKRYLEKLSAKVGEKDA
ncbi:MAG: protein kinase domain-containing protein [Thermodesulfobacteriota bacterium]